MASAVHKQNPQRVRGVKPALKHIPFVNFKMRVVGVI